MRYLVGLLGLFLLVSCNHKNDDSAETYKCESPVLFDNARDETTHGFLVAIDEEVDVNTEATRFLEKYEDLEVFSTINSCNCFHADSGEETRKALQCESSVTSMGYNNAQ